MFAFAVCPPSHYDGFAVNITRKDNIMSETPKQMCKWDKRTIRKKFAAFADAVRHPEYACMKCGRVAATRKTLCSPESLGEKK